MKEKIIAWIIAIIFAILVLGIIGFDVYVNIKYWTTPIGELPFWVTWFMWRG